MCVVRIKIGHDARTTDLFVVPHGGCGDLKVPNTAHHRMISDASSRVPFLYAPAVVCCLFKTDTFESEGMQIIHHLPQKSNAAIHSIENSRVINIYLEICIFNVVYSLYLLLFMHI